MSQSMPSTGEVITATACQIPREKTVLRLVSWRIPANPSRTKNASVELVSCTSWPEATF
jgi:hypothetical protein